MMVADALSVFVSATPAELWTRRAGFALMFAELLFEDERRVLAAAIHDLSIDAASLAVIEAAFRRTAALVLGVRP